MINNFLLKSRMVALVVRYPDCHRLHSVVRYLDYHRRHLLVVVAVVVLYLQHRRRQPEAHRHSLDEIQRRRFLRRAAVLRRHQRQHDEVRRLQRLRRQCLDHAAHRTAHICRLHDRHSLRRSYRQRHFLEVVAQYRRRRRRCHHHHHRRR